MYDIYMTEHLRILIPKIATRATIIIGFHTDLLLFYIP